MIVVDFHLPYLNVLWQHLSERRLTAFVLLGSVTIAQDELKFTTKTILKVVFKSSKVYNVFVPLSHGLCWPFKQSVLTTCWFYHLR